MKSLSNLVEENIQRVITQPSYIAKLEDWERNFLKAQEYVNNLSLNYENYLKNALNNKNYLVKKNNFGKKIIITIEWFFGKNNIVIEIVEGENKEIERVRYYAHNNTPSYVYIRNIV